jgi:dipeptidyl aminopeptidase/acylaminoacyl peptidase
MHLLILNAIIKHFHDMKLFLGDCPTLRRRSPGWLSIFTPLFVHRRLAGIALICLAALPALAQGTQADYDRAFSLRQTTARLVYRAEIKAHWLADDRFWYRVQTGAHTHEFILVNAETGARQPAFDHARLAQSLGQTLKRTFTPDDLPLSELDFSSTNAFTFFANGKGWLCQLADYSIQPATANRNRDGLRELPAPHPSYRTGDDVLLNFINQTTNSVKLFWIDPSGDRQPYGLIPAGETKEQNTHAGHVWLITTGAGEQLAVFEANDSGGDAIISASPAPHPDSHHERHKPDTDSPDGQWRAFIRDNNVYLRDLKTGAESALSTSGSDTDYFDEEFHWSPDSTHLALTQTVQGEEHKIYLIESSPTDQLQPKLLTEDYYKPGDKLPISRVRLFDVAAHRQIPVPEGSFTNAYSLDEIRWWPDSSRFTYLYNRRGHQVLQIVAVNAQTGESQAVVDEHSQTFIDYSGKEYSCYLDGTHEIIWMSERDGWNHLYLYDAATGQVKNQITHGDWVVRSVDFVDETNRQIWFSAGGIRPGQDPYYLHTCRVNFDGTGLVILTADDGTHQTDFSPDRKYFVDSWSRVDQAPITELRRSSDGQLVCPLEQADIHDLLATGWQMPERFTAPGRDGVTSIYGVIFRPSTFKPGQKYPVVEDIYAGPQDSFTPKSFKPFYGQQEIAELGFIVVQMDGMGTSNRSKKFHDVCWKNLADAGFPDRVLWIKAAAAQHLEMDLARVGIYGGSAGGQNALRALLDHGDFYKVSVADCGCHDNRMDKVWWNEQWMGWPVDDSYIRSSNVVDAHKLQGKLLLMVGELDHNVDPSSTMQVVNALEKAGKDFEMLVVTGSDHGAAETTYGKRRRADFLVRNLLGVEPRRPAGT